MSNAFLVARNPRAGSRLPYLLRLPLADGAITLATRDTWPGTRDLFCFEVDGWPSDAELVEEVPVSTCRREGAAVRLILARRQRRRSLFVWAPNRRGRTLVFWRSERSMRGARPTARVPTARGLEGPLTVAIDVRERYPWRFARKRVTTERRSLPVGDYAVFEGERLVAAVERKGALELAGDAVSGKLALTLAELATLPRGAVVIEGRLSDLLKGDVPVQPGWLLNLVASHQAAHPAVPLLFAETPKLAGDLAYRWLAACLKEVADATPARAAAPRGGGRRRDAAGDPAQPTLFELDGGAASPAGTLGAAAGQARADAPHGPEERRRQARHRAWVGEVWTTGAYAAAFGVSAHTARADLRALVEAGALARRGKGRGTRYVAVGVRAPEGSGGS